MTNQADVIRRFLTGGYSSFPFEREMRDEALVALDLLLAENQSLRDKLADLTAAKSDKLTKH